jgi:AcrR family transcriptional regulator
MAQPTERENKPALPRRRGRPPGPSAQGTAARRRLYETAIALISDSGYEGATLREVAKRAGVSVGLLYRYFPDKRAVVLELYDQLSAKYSADAAHMPPGKWRDRFVFALVTSLETLRPHRTTLAALIPVLVGDGKEGLFAPATAFSRQRVQAVFHEAVSSATDAPSGDVIASLARLLYLAHLAIILWWLLDKSPRQRATDGLVALLKRALPAATLTLRLRAARKFIIAGDRLFGEALVNDS